MSFRFKRDWAVAPKADLRTVWFVQPLIDDYTDYLVDGIVQLSWRLTERLTLTFDLRPFS